MLPMPAPESAVGPDWTAQALTLLFWLATASLVIGLARRARLWRAGRPAAVPWRALLAIPKRYFVDLHDVVAREPAVARAHVATAGGAVASLLLVALNYGLAIYAPALDLAIVASAAVMLAGTAWVWQRRRQPPARLSRGAWQRLPYTLAAFAAGLALLALLALLPSAVLSQGIGFVALALLLAGSAELALGIGRGGPMKHAVAGLLHLGLHPRPERFRGAPKDEHLHAGRAPTALQPLALERGELGIEKPRDFAWNRLLSFDACVQCGKCEAACPAYAAGQPLNPKKLVQDLVVGMAGGSDAAYAGRPMPGRPVGQAQGGPELPIAPGLIAPETLWSCTTCRACVQECPMLIEHVDAIVGMRRHLTLAGGELPGTAMPLLEQLRHTDTQGGHPLGARHHWAADLALPVLPPASDDAAPVTDWLLLVGEAGYDLRAQRTLRAFVKTLQRAGIVPAVLGVAETDCGDLARRLGDEAGFRRLATQLAQTLAARRFRRIVTTDPHLLHCLQREYPALGAHFEVWHHTQLLAQLLDDGRLTPTQPAAAAATPVTYHDPCYLGRYSGETDAPRRALKKIGIPIVEMERHGLRGRCCGGGGGAPYTDIPGQTRIPDLRIGDANACGAGVVAVACPNCTAMLEGVTGPRPEVLDVAELVARAVEAV